MKKQESVKSSGFIFSIQQVKGAARLEHARER